MHVESALVDGIHVFKLAELHAAYENRLKNLNTFSANRTRLKGELLETMEFKWKQFFLIFPNEKFGNIPLSYSELYNWLQ